MKTCKRCGNEIAENATICPVCGTMHGQPGTSNTSTSYGQYPGSSFGESPSLQDRTSQYILYTQPQTYQELPNRVVAGYNPVYTYLPQHLPRGNNYAPPLSTTPSADKIHSALMTEIVLSLLGIFGVGWLMAGETTIGVVLLLGSILIYWPVMLLGTIFTMGFGLICLGPLAIGAIILNILLLSSVLRRHRIRQRYQRQHKEQ